MCMLDMYGMSQGDDAQGNVSGQLVGQQFPQTDLSRFEIQ